LNKFCYVTDEIFEFRIEDRNADTRCVIACFLSISVPGKWLHKRSCASGVIRHWRISYCVLWQFRRVVTVWAAGLSLLRSTGHTGKAIEKGREVDADSEEESHADSMTIPCPCGN